jgi:hypothetical protein
MVLKLMSRRQQIIWNDGERIYSRVERAKEGWPRALLARPAAEHPLPATLNRMVHEYSLREELDSAWALRPRALEYDSGQPRLIFDDPGGEPLLQLLSAPRR